MTSAEKAQKALENMHKARSLADDLLVAFYATDAQRDLSFANAEREMAQLAAAFGYVKAAE